MTITNTAAAAPIRIHAAGSLHAAMSDVAEAFEREYGTPVAATFGPSGLLRQRIAEGERADVFLTYRTNTVLAQDDAPDLRTVQNPDELSAGADYGLSLLRRDQTDAARFALFVLPSKGQAILADCGFTAPALP